MTGDSGDQGGGGPDFEGSRSSGEIAWEWRSRIATGMAVMQRDVASLIKTVEGLGTDIKQTYATKVELKEVKDNLEKVNGNISWLIKLIVGLVVVAILGAIIVKAPIR